MVGIISSGTTGNRSFTPSGFEKPGVLYFEKAPDGAHKAPKDKAEEFIARAKTLGVDVDADSLLQLSNGRIVIAEIM